MAELKQSVVVKVAAKAEGVRSHVDSSCIERLLIWNVTFSRPSFLEDGKNISAYFFWDTVYSLFLRSTVTLWRCAAQVISQIEIITCNICYFCSERSLISLRDVLNRLSFFTLIQVKPPKCSAVCAPKKNPRVSR